MPPDNQEIIPGTAAQALDPDSGSADGPESIEQMTFKHPRNILHSACALLP